MSRVVALLNKYKFVVSRQFRPINRLRACINIIIATFCKLIIIASAYDINNDYNNIGNSLIH